MNDQIEKSLQEAEYWAWSELMLALKHSQGLLSEATSTTSLGSMLDPLLDSVVAHFEAVHETSPCSSTSSSTSVSTDEKSLENSRNVSFHTMWWFDDLTALSIPMIKMLITSMVSQNIGTAVVSKFLFYYQKKRFSSASPGERADILEGIVGMLSSLDTRCMPYKGLFEILRSVSSKNVNVSEHFRWKLVSMIGSVLDHATLDDLLVPPCRGSAKNYCTYDVNLVLNLIRSFNAKGAMTRAKKVASLMDSYLFEIAPDPYLKPSKFLAMINALPNSARDSSDGVYHAVTLYLQVHRKLSEKWRMKICSVLNYEKLSSKAIQELIQNGTSHFPAKCVADALICQQCRLKGLLHGESSMEGNRVDANEHQQVMILYAGKLHPLDESGKLKKHLEGMQWRASELESVCCGMGLQVAKMMRSRSSSHGFISNLCL